MDVWGPASFFHWDYFTLLGGAFWPTKMWCGRLVGSTPGPGWVFQRGRAGRDSIVAFLGLFELTTWG